jgi:hypothetical protein
LHIRWAEKVKYLLFSQKKYFNTYHIGRFIT